MAISQTRRFGILLVLVSAVMWSTAGLFVRMADLDIWSVIGWRSLFSAVVLGGWLALRCRGGADAALHFGVPGVAATLIATVAAISYIMSLTWTTVANVMTIYATLPFVATLIAFIWFRERVSARFVIAGVVAFIGVCVMVGAAFSPRDLLGIVAAVVMTLCFALQLVISRRYPRLDTVLMLTLAAVFCLLVALPNMQLVIPPTKSLLACALYGILSTGLGYTLVLIGGRIIGPGEAGFLSMLDVVLGPFWVWIFYGETIGPATFAGGGAVLLAVIWYLAGDSKPRRVE
ncbi:MAG TPA: DMT family transporter [Paenirhodobacter sp.]